MSIDPEKLLVLFAIAVVVLGPERLPRAARTLGKALAEVRRYTSAFRSEFGDVLAEPRAIVEAAVHEADMRAELRRAGDMFATGSTNGLSGNGSGANGSGANGSGANGSGANGPGGNGSSGYGSGFEGSAGYGPGGAGGEGASTSLPPASTLLPATGPDDPALN